MPDRTAIVTHRGSGRRRRTPRRGAVVVLFMFFLVISVLVGALAINWSYLVTVQHHMQHTADLVALAGTPELLDESLLGDLAADQTDDVAAALAESDRFRARNELETSARLAVDEDDVTVTPGFVPDLSARFDERVFLGTAPFNALRVKVQRRKDGNHPVRHLINGFWNADPVDVSATSIAALDDRLIGFRPTMHSTAPVLPLAISETAWNARSDADGNGLRELVFRLKSSDSAASAPANGALVDLGGVIVNLARIKEQISGGVRQSHLPGGELGPLGPGPGPGSLSPLMLPATEDSPNENETAAIVALLNDIATSPRPRRALPVYRSFNAGQVDVIGFVGVRVIKAEDEETGGATDQQRLKVTMEPSYVVHATAWTGPEAAVRNPYICKLRLLQ